MGVSSRSFLERGTPRYGDVTSNAVEQVNSAIRPARDLSIIKMFQRQDADNIKHSSKRRSQAEKWTKENRVFTGYYDEEVIQKRTVLANRFDIKMAQLRRR